MANLALAVGLQRMPCEEGQAMLFQTRTLGAKFGGLLRAQPFHGSAEGNVASPGAMLVELALRSDASNDGARAGAIGKHLGTQNACFGKTARIRFGGCEGITEREHAEAGDADIALDSGRRASRPKTQEVVIIIVDEECDRDDADDCLGQK